jgi:hypothetical protein
MYHCPPFSTLLIIWTVLAGVGPTRAPFSLDTSWKTGELSNLSSYTYHLFIIFSAEAGRWEKVSTRPHVSAKIARQGNILTRPHTILQKLDVQIAEDEEGVAQEEKARDAKLAEAGDKLSEDEKKELEQRVEELRYYLALAKERRTALKLTLAETMLEQSSFEVRDRI